MCLPSIVLREKKLYRSSLNVTRGHHPISTNRAFSLVFHSLHIFLKENWVTAENFSSIVFVLLEWWLDSVHSLGTCRKHMLFSIYLDWLSHPGLHIVINCQWIAHRPSCQLNIDGNSTTFVTNQMIFITVWKHSRNHRHLRTRKARASSHPHPSLEGLPCTSIVPGRMSFGMKFEQNPMVTWP